MTTYVVRGHYRGRVSEYRFADAREARRMYNLLAMNLPARELPDVFLEWIEEDE